MKYLLPVVLLALYVTSEAGIWKPLKVGDTDKFKFDPESMVFEFGIVPKATLEDLDFNVAARVFDENNRLVGVTSFLYQMKGKKVIKNLLRIGARNGNVLKYCYDRRVLRGQVPGNIFQDLMDPAVYVINKARSPNFAGNKGCSPWRNLIAKKNIVSAELVFSDRGGNTVEQLDIQFRIINVETATTTYEPITYYATSEGIQNLELLEATEAPVASSGDICSVYPNGVIDTFDKKSEHYDLKCYHVLAASFGSPSWFIYGAYDKFDGKKSCRAMAVYVGSKAFEIVRGWMINYGGEKLKYTEGEEKTIGDTGCVMSLTNLHLTVDCRPGGFPFVVHYDGYMLAHVELFERTGNEMGLCFENSRGRRLNWQIGNQNSRNQDCTISPVISECEEAALQCAEFENACDGALARACRELSCGQTQPTSEQICSLSLARKKKCHLLGSNSREKLTGCPDDVCLRKFFVLGAGCPQDHFFTGCPVENYLNDGKTP